MRRLSAHYVFTSNSQLLRFGIVELDANGTIVNVVDTLGVMSEMHLLEFYNGILVPGFVGQGVDLHKNTQACFIQFKNEALTLPKPNLAFLLAKYTIDEAKALQANSSLGSVEAGKSPGIYLLTNVDFELMSLTPTSELVQLV